MKVKYYCVFLPQQKSRKKIAEIGLGRRGKSVIVVQKSGVLNIMLVSRARVLFD